MTTLEKIQKCRELDDRTTHVVYVCGNDETLLDGSYFQHTSGGDEAATAMVEAACRVIEDSGRRVDYEVSHNFRDWHVGRFRQFYAGGWVVCDRDAPQWLRDLCEKADEAMSSELVALEATAEASDREFLADCLRDGEELDESQRWFIEQILFPTARFASHTTESIEAALRANDVGLLVDRDD